MSDFGFLLGDDRTQKKWEKIAKKYNEIHGTSGHAATAPWLKPLRLPHAQNQGIDKFVAFSMRFFHSWVIQWPKGFSSIFTQVLANDKIGDSPIQ